MDIRLAQKKCSTNSAHITRLSHAQIETLKKELTRDWEIIDSRKMRYEFAFSDFKSAMRFVDAVARLAEEEGHHPDMHIFYSRVMIELWTHTASGLSENDFILAAKIEQLPSIT